MRSGVVRSNLLRSLLYILLNSPSERWSTLVVHTGDVDAKFLGLSVSTRATARKSFDGVSKLLLKSDLHKFTSKEANAKVRQIEKQIITAEAMKNQLVDSDAASPDMARDK